MSDITIRFDGLVLLAALAFGALGFLGVAISAGIFALTRRVSSRRARRLARNSSIMFAATLSVFLAVFGYWANSGTSHQGVNWIDALAIPVALALAAGGWSLART